MNRLYTPGQIARWEAARLKREALVRPAPISFDPSKAEVKFPRLTHGGQLTHAERKAERVQETVAATERKPASDPPVASQGVNSGPLPWQRCGSSLPAPQPLDLSGVTLDAEGWSSEIPVPDNLNPWRYLRKTLSLCRSDEIRYRVTGGDLVAIRIKARPASDTEGLPTGAVVRVWWDGIERPKIPRYASPLCDAWSWSTLDAASPHATACAKDGWAYSPGAVYLPIDVRGA
jgi:hypothetical protein